MTINSGDFAVALKAGGGWTLKQLCPATEASYGLAVRSGDGWAFAPQGEKKSSYMATLATFNGQAVLPLECPDEEEDPPDEGDPCSGVDPLCSLCVCEAALRQTYLVTLSGFPDICGAAAFNGVWSVSHISDCVWRYDIDQWCSVQLSAQAGVAWRVSWGIAESGGLGGYFAGYFGEECVPQSHTYYYAYDFTSGCAGLRTALMSSVFVGVD